MLRNELQSLQANREEDIIQSVERYKELEEALAQAQIELEDPEQYITKEINSTELAKLSEMISQQDNVLKDLVMSLEASKISKNTLESDLKLKKSEIESEYIYIYFKYIYILKKNIKIYINNLN